MQPKACKTVLTFHAKDDLPEVRREVLALLRSIEGLRFFAVVKDILQPKKPLIRAALVVEITCRRMGQLGSSGSIRPAK